MLEMDEQAGKMVQPHQLPGVPACEPELSCGSCLENYGGLAGILQRWTLCFLPA